MDTELMEAIIRWHMVKEQTTINKKKKEMHGRYWRELDKIKWEVLSKNKVSKE